MFTKKHEQHIQQFIKIIQKKNSRKCTEFPDSTIREVGVGSLPSVVKNIVALAVSHVKTNVAEIAKTEPNGRISGVFVFGCKVNLALTGAESAYPPFFVRAVRCTTPVRVRV
jgi:hypothetical protein